LFRQFFALLESLPNRTYRVTFEDSSGLKHTATVAASSLYEAAVLALRQFRTSSFAEVTAGKGTRLSVSIALEEESHDITVGQVEGWLQSMGNTVNA